MEKVTLLAREGQNRAFNEQCVVRNGRSWFIAKQYFPTLPIIPILSNLGQSDNLSKDHLNRPMPFPHS